MLLTIHNLPSSCRYSDIKNLLQEKCGLTELILDNLVSEGKMKRVTVGLADEGDAAILVRKINGLYINGQQLYVEDKRKKRDLDQPYRSSASMIESDQYQETMANPQPIMDGAMMAGMNNPMMMNYNMMGMYMPVQSVDQSMPYIAYSVPQVMPSAEFVPGASIPNERGFQGDRNRQGRPDGSLDRVRDGPQDRPWERTQGKRNGPQDGPRDGPPGRNRDVLSGRGRDGPQGRNRDGPQGRNRDRNRRPSPERPSETFNRPRRDENAAKFPMRREKSPPRLSRISPEMNQGPRAPFRQPERLGPREPHQFQPRQPEPEFRRTDPQWDEPSHRPSRWEAEPEPHMRPEPHLRPEHNREWSHPGPIQNFEQQLDRPFDQTNRIFEEPNQPWDRHPNKPDEVYPHPDRFEPNQQRFDNDFPPNQFRNEPEFREPAFHDDALEFQGHERGFHGREPDCQMLDQPEPGYNNDRERRPRQTDAPWKKGNDSRDRDWNNRGDRREDRPIPYGRPGPKPSTSKGNDRRDDRQPNPKRPHSDFSRAPDKWSEISNDYPASKKPRGIAEVYGPRHKPPIHESRNVRPPLIPGPRPAAPVVKQFTMKSLINKDQTSRGQATAVLSKQIITTLDLSDPGNRLLLKEVKNCIRGRIDVLFGEQLSTSCEDVIKRYRAKYSKEKDRDFYKALREKVDKAEAERKLQNQPNEAVKEEVVVKVEAPVDDSLGPDLPIGAQIQQLDSKLNELTRKAPNRPLTDKQIISAQKRQSKLEFTKKDLFKLDPIMDKVLEEELNKLNDILQSECDNPKDETESKICQQISTQSAEELKSVLKVHLTKRILNITSGLPVRIFSEGKLPRKEALKQFLHSYRIERLTLKKNKKGTMYIINLSNYEEYDQLCQMEHVLIDGVPVIFRSMNLLGPPMRMSRNQVLKRRKEFIQNQVAGEDDMLEDFTEDVDDDNFKYDDLEDF